MDKNNFKFNESLYGSGTYTADINGFHVEIGESIFSDEKIEFAEKVIKEYPLKLYDLAVYCKASGCFQACYPNETAESIMEKLNLPTLRIDNVGGRFTYCNHELDFDHLIDIDFVGVMDSFIDVGIDG